MAPEKSMLSAKFVKANQ